ncbi:MAG: hypothetical protein WCP36_07705 [Methanomicrobiales archaeon]
MSPGSGLLQKARRNIIDFVELGIVVMSVIIYYVLRIFTGPFPAAAIAIAFGMISLYTYVKNPHVQSAVQNWGKKESI